MTQKELLYVEDAIGHESNIIKILENTICNMSDKDLCSFLKKEMKKHTLMKDKLVCLLKEKAND